MRAGIYASPLVNWGYVYLFVKYQKTTYNLMCLTKEYFFGGIYG